MSQTEYENYSRLLLSCVGTGGTVILGLAFVVGLVALTVAGIKNNKGENK